MWRGEAPLPARNHQQAPAKRQGDAAAGAAGEATPTEQGAGVLIPGSRSLWTGSPGAGNHVRPNLGMSGHQGGGVSWQNPQSGSPDRRWEAGGGALESWG